MNDQQDNLQKMTIAKNPFSEPLNMFIRELINCEWIFPYISTIIRFIIILIIIIIVSLFYITIGVLSQISTTLWNLIKLTSDKINISNPMGSSAYAIAIGVYFFIFIFPFIIQLPFWVLGWILTKFKLTGFIVFLCAIIVIAIIFFIIFTKIYPLNGEYSRDKMEYRIR
jgi:hypothetical protein